MDWVASKIAFLSSVAQASWDWAGDLDPRAAFLAGLAAWFLAERVMRMVSTPMRKAVTLLALVSVAATSAGIVAAVQDGIEVPSFSKATSHPNENFFREWDGS